MTYRNQTVRLADLAVITDLLQGVTFENCVIVGPAVIVLMGTTSLSNSSFDGDAEGLLWPFPDDRERLIGAVGLSDCTIVGCRLQRIGLAFPVGEQAKIMQGLGLS